MDKIKYLKLFSTIIRDNGLHRPAMMNKTNIDDVVELNCEDSAFFCALHILELSKAIASELPDEERESFYKLIKENLPHGTYQ